MAIVVEVVDQTYVWDSGSTASAVLADDGKYYAAWGIAIGDDTDAHSYSVYGGYDAAIDAIQTLHEVWPSKY